MKIGIVGLGIMGKNHLRVLNSLKGMVDTISIFDSNDIVAKKLQRIYDVKYFESFEEFLESVDAVSICTPTTTHYSIAKTCLLCNKDILIEKPITASIDEAIDLISLVEKTNKLCMIGHIERFNPAIMYLRHYLNNKKIVSISANRISRFEKNRRFDVDVVTDLMIHDIDIIIDLVNAIPEHVLSIGIDDGFDSVFAIMKFKSNIAASLNANRTSHEKIRTLYIMTNEECIHVDYINKSIEFVKTPDLDSFNIHSKKQLLVFEEEPLVNEYKHFIECINNRQKPISNEITGYNSLKIAKTINESLKKEAFN